MDLNLDDEQRLIVDSAADFLGASSDIAAVRAAFDSADGFDRNLWRGVAELGWCGIGLPEEAGGLGLGWVELSLLQEQLGRHLSCVPYFDSVVLATSALEALSDNATAQALLPELAAGEKVAALALGEPQQRPTAQAKRQGDGWQIDGRWPLVSSAHIADVLLLPALDEQGQSTLFLVNAGTTGLQIQLHPSIDGTRRVATVQAQAVQLPADACLAQGQALDQQLGRVRCLAAIALAAEQVGVAEQALNITLAYVNEREQFEKKIAGFQAIKHRCAQMLVAVETARSAVYGAACTADTDPDDATLLFHAAQARTEATEAALYCTREAIQLHGGVGFTWEYDPHLFFRRAQVASQTLGGLSWWREQVAIQLLDGQEAKA